MYANMSFGDPYIDSFHNEIMNTMDPSLLFLTSSSSDSECSLSSDGERAVDLIKYLDSESDDVQQEIIPPEQDNAINNIIFPEQDNAINNIIPPEQDNVINIIFPQQDNAVNIIFPEQDNAVNIISPEQDNADNIISPEQDNADNIISPEQDNADNIISPEQDNADNHFLLSPVRDNGINNFLLSPVTSLRNTYGGIGYGPTLTSINANLMSMMTGSFANPHWVISPERSNWLSSLVGPETTVPPSPPRVNALNLDQHINEEHMIYLTPEDMEYLYGSETEEQPEEKKTKSDNVAGDDSVDSYVDVELVDSHDALMSTVMFEENSPVATTSRSTEHRKKFALVFAPSRANRAPKPVGRPRGSKKKAAAATTGQASTSQFTLQPSCSTSNTETPAASRCVAVGQKRKFKCETIPSAQTQPDVSPVLVNNFSVNFHDYAMSPLSSASPSSASQSSESSLPMAPTRRPYRRNASLDVVDKDKQNHHNQLERNRRQKLADLFTNLRVAVPRIAGNPKASKVLILNEAVSHINHLEQTDTLQNAEVFREEQKQRLLKNQLKQLRARLSSRLK